MAPTAPTDAASVGVATPPKIEPSTARISSTGATSDSRLTPLARDVLFNDALLHFLGDR